jgi:hypothetical protein
MSSLCAADAAFTSAEFAAAMDFAASKIISSKFRFSSASCQQKHNPIGAHITVNSIGQHVWAMGFAAYTNLPAARVKL